VLRWLNGEAQERNRSAEETLAETVVQETVLKESVLKEAVSKKTPPEGIVPNEWPLDDALHEMGYPKPSVRRQKEILFRDAKVASPRESLKPSQETGVQNFERLIRLNRKCGHLRSAQQLAKEANC
jgi:hypothetical protein